MKFIGITGGVGAGKSEILSYIKKHYRAEIYLADEVAGSLREPGGACYGDLVSLLGSEVLENPETKNSPIDRKKMAAMIFADKALLKKVNAMMHPAVKEFLLARKADAEKRGDTDLFFVEAALLIETGYGAVVDEMWYIYAEEEVRRTRLMQNRGYDEQRIDGIMKSQNSEDFFRRNSDFILDNSGDLEKTYSQLRGRLEAYTWLD